MSATVEERQKAADQADEMIKSLTAKPQENDEPNPAEAEQPTPKQTAEPDSEWKRRYSNLRNSRDERVEAQKQQMAGMQAQIKELQDKLALAAQTSTQSKPIPDGVLSQDEIDMVGEDNLAIVSKLAQAQAKSLADGHVSKLESRIEDLTSRLQRYEQYEAQKAQDTAKSTLHKRMTELFPEWEKVDKDPAFATWMQEPDPVSGAPRVRLFVAAKQNNDIYRLASFYREYGSVQQEQHVDPRQAKVTPPSRPSGDVPSQQRRYSAQEYYKLQNDIATRRVDPSQMTAALDKIKEMEAQLFQQR